jgi:hypothetical protein
MSDKEEVIKNPVVLQDAPEYIRNFVNNVSQNLQTKIKNYIVKL